MKISAAGLDVRYELIGDQTSPVVVLSHSLGTSLEIWDNQISALTESFQVLRYDTRGHGGTSAPEGSYSMDMLVEDAVSLLDVLGLEKVHWVGLSMGGMIGQGIAIKHPNRLLSLSLCNTVASVTERAQETWRIHSLPKHSVSLANLVDYAMYLLFSPEFKASHPKEYQAVRQQYLRTSAHGYTACALAVVESDFTQNLSTILAPTLIISGDRDIATPKEEAEFMHSLIPNSNLEVIADAAHLSNVEQPEVFNEVLLSFLQLQQ